MKKLIYGMSYKSKYAKSNLQTRSSALNDRIMKCAVYQDSTGDLNHWLDGISEILSFANDMTIKPSARKLSKTDYLDNLCGTFGDELSDARVNLKGFHGQHSGEDYPEFDITDELVEKLFSYYQIIITKIVPILATKNTLKQNYFKNTIRRYFK